MRRTLSLTSETLTDLTPDLLGAVAGGAAPDSLRVRDCFEPLTHPTALDCITGPFTTVAAP